MDRTGWMRGELHSRKDNLIFATCLGKPMPATLT
jgi:hypothetical protein